MRFDGLERDVTYHKYIELRQRVIEQLLDDDSDLENVGIYIHVLQSTRDTLDKIKEYNNGSKDDIN
jgi:hypothetical protein